MRCFPIVAAALLISAPAQAEIVSSSEGGFVLRHAADVSSGVAAVWALVLRPADWWNGEHSFSGDAANLSIEPLPGGCFCEMLPAANGTDEPLGGVEHARVTYIEQPRVLRLTGGLGPLQAEPVHGVLTMALRPIDGGTRIMWEYVVGGYMREGGQKLAPAVDGMIGEQLSRLADKLGRVDKPAGRTPRPIEGR